MLAAILPLLLLALPLLAFAYLMRGGAANLINQPENPQVNLPPALRLKCDSPLSR